MTIRAYCDAAYAIILDEYQRKGMALTDALDRLTEWAVAWTRDEEALSEAAIARQNEASLRQFEAMMGGVGA